MLVHFSREILLAKACLRWPVIGTGQAQATDRTQKILLSLERVDRLLICVISAHATFEVTQLPDGVIA